MISGPAFAQSKLANQAVYTWPDGYIGLGANFILYNYDKGETTHWVDNTTPGSGIDDFMIDYDLLWCYGDVGNFNGGVDAWVDGDLCIWFGSWDSAYAVSPVGYGSNAGHTGYVWFSQENVAGTEDPWFWPDEYGQVMPMATVSQAGDQGMVTVEIPNLPETGVPPATYSVAGYYIVANGVLGGEPSGTPDDFTFDIGYFPQSGGPGSSTFAQYDPQTIYPTGGSWTTYHAYYIVFRDNTHSTEYMSQNSNKVVIVGIAEGKTDTPKQLSMVATPSVFARHTQLTYALPQTTPVKLTIHNASGQIVNTLVDEVKTAGRYTVEFDDESLPSGVYFYSLRTSEKQLNGKLTLLR